MPIKEKKLYNKELKEKFINSYDNENTQEVIGNILQHAYLTETVLQKDLYDFNVKEIADVIKASDPLTPYVAYDYGRKIKNYIDFYIDRRRESNINPINGMMMEWYTTLVNPKKIFFSKNEIDDIITHLVNPQDQAVISLYFEGVSGYEASELRNLKVSDIDRDSSEIKLLDDKDGNERMIKVSPECLAILFAASNQSIYFNSNGHVASRGVDEIKLVENEYVLRPITRRVQDYTAPIGVYLIYKRLTIVQEEFNIPYFRGKAIQRSGMIHMAKNLYLRDGEIGRKQLEEIAAHYNTGTMTSMGQYHYLNTSLLTRFINRDNIYKLYGIDIDE